MIEAIRIVKDYASRTHPHYSCCVIEAKCLGAGYLVTMHCSPNLSTLSTSWRVMYFDNDRQSVSWDMSC